MSLAIIVTISVFGVGQLSALAILIFHVGQKAKQLDNIEDRVSRLESARDILIPAVARLQALNEEKTTHFNSLER